MRTDCHSPSKIIPSDYEYIGPECQKIEGMEDATTIRMFRERIERHMAKTGGTYSDHNHKGNCHCCGAHCIYTVLFYHASSNSYIRLGNTCASKLEMGNEADFRSIRVAVKRASEAKAGKQKAQAVLAEHDLMSAWEVYTRDYTQNPQAISRDEITIRDVVHNLVKYGRLTEKQVSFLRMLLNRVENRPALEATRAAEKATAKDAPSGRVTITAEVIKTEVRDSYYGTQVKMTVKTSEGWLAWGTVPSSLEYFDHPTEKAFEGSDTPVQRGLQRGDKIELTASFTPSDKDSKFAFFKRPIATLTV